MYDDEIEKLFDSFAQLETTRHDQRHLITMHRNVASRTNPTVLELGVQSGRSTRLFLNAIHKGDGGHVVSVDIDDCSMIAVSPRWTFVRSDSTAIDQVIASAPVLKNGIDVLYVDSLHHVEHVRKELFGFFPYINDGGTIFFDDVDSLPYMRGRESDSLKIEIGNRAILTLLNEVFEDNLDKLYFSFHRGATGLAQMEKRAPLGVGLSETALPRARYNRLFWKYRQSLEKRLHGGRSKL